jgi:large subunit ribosomal protein L30
MPQIQVKLVRSAIDRPERQKRTVEALGLNKMNSVATHEANPSILGMVKSIQHLLEVSVYPSHESFQSKTCRWRNAQ